MTGTHKKSAIESTGALEEAGRLMGSLEREPAHTLQVARLAALLFDELASLHGLGPRDRLLLDCAARLHDVGWSVATDGKGHHKESARLIRKFAWRSLSPAEVELVAQIARYHRKAPPSTEHEEFTRLTTADRDRVEKLGALVRIADGLDRSHLQKVRSIACAVRPGAMKLTVYADSPLIGELEAAAKKADLAERVWKRRVAFDLVVAPGKRR